MKRLSSIILTFFLLFGQFGSLEHAYHDHQESELCEFCLKLQPFEHITDNSIQLYIPANNSQCQNETVSELSVNRKLSYFAARAPPFLI